MKKNQIIVLVVAIIGVTYKFLQGEKVSLGLERNKTGYQVVQNINDVFQVYPATVNEVIARSQKVQKELKNDVDVIIAATEKTKENQLRALDQAVSGIGFYIGVLELVHMVHPDKDVREAATAEYQVLNAVYIESIAGNKELYESLKAYNTCADRSTFTQEEILFLDELLDDYKRAGMDLPEAERAVVMNLKKRLSELSTQFEVNIAQDCSTITATQEQLAGVPEDFIKGLAKDDAGLFILKMDYPTQDAIMRYCSVQDTRKRFYKTNNNKAYPQNVSVLNEIVNLRDQLAKALGFKSYAELDLADQMIKTPERAWKLQRDLLPVTKAKADKEIKHFLSDLPEGVALTKEGKVFPWDLGYITNYFKKKHYDVDELVIAEYFPMQQTVDGLFKIYQKFFNLEFKTINNPEAWHKDVQLVEIKRKNGTLLGYVFMDMFPRDNKFNHAAKFSALPARKSADGLYTPAVCTVVCNFTEPTANKPSLLKYDEVNVFFHEFGHALHYLLGGTDLASQAGTNVKSDFLELPSQMLENWMEDKAILKMLSKHYKTNEPLSDELIDKKLSLLKLSTGIFESRQIWLGMVALEIFESGENKDSDAIVKKYAQETFDYMVFDNEGHFQYSFGHLTGYGAKYYGYLWSRVIACDIFAEIEKEGLLNPEAGARYSAALLEPGGSKNPNDMVHEYLGREPNQKAFLEKSGF
ncbi:Zn-dependent oligopeptidase [Candidatus Babeliales bacterium]|nr:Zn-dependent oligopeptidase [Candidatus Babeliales bacterium]